MHIFVVFNQNLFLTGLAKQIEVLKKRQNIFYVRVHGSCLPDYKRGKQFLVRRKKIPERILNVKRCFSTQYFLEVIHKWRQTKMTIFRPSPPPVSHSVTYRTTPLKRCHILDPPPQWILSLNVSECSRALSDRLTE